MMFQFAASRFQGGGGEKELSSSSEPPQLGFPFTRRAVVIGVYRYVAREGFVFATPQAELTYLFGAVGMVNCTTVSILLAASQLPRRAL